MGQVQFGKCRYPVDDKDASEEAIQCLEQGKLEDLVNFGIGLKLDCGDLQRHAMRPHLIMRAIISKLVKAISNSFGESPFQSTGLAIGSAEKGWTTPFACPAAVLAIEHSGCYLSAINVWWLALFKTCCGARGHSWRSIVIAREHFLASIGDA